MEQGLEGMQGRAAILTERHGRREYATNEPILPGDWNPFLESNHCDLGVVHGEAIHW